MARHFLTNDLDHGCFNPVWRHLDHIDERLLCVLILDVRGALQRAVPYRLRVRFGALGWGLRSSISRCSSAMASCAMASTLFGAMSSLGLRPRTEPSGASRVLGASRRYSAWK